MISAKSATRNPSVLRAVKSTLIVRFLSTLIIRFHYGVFQSIWSTKSKISLVLSVVGQRSACLKMRQHSVLVSVGSP